MQQKGDLSQHSGLGKAGEDIAAKFLQSKGYRILHRNWHFGHKELDIVSMYEGVLIVVEVKTRTSSYWEEPKDSVRRKKQKNIIDATDAYAQRYNIDMDIQFDIISIVWAGANYSIEHIEDAFHPTI